MLPDPAQAIPRADAAELVLALGDIPICHSTPEPSSGDDRHSQAPKRHDCTLCPACQLAHAAAAAILPVATADLARLRDAAAPVRAHPATGPPQPHRTAARPRGPPAFSV